jgi:prepilin-type N-terminal cleavage/methylation domain-containing protein
MTRSSFKTAGDWPGTIAAMVVRSLRSKLCLSPSPTGFETASTLVSNSKRRPAMTLIEVMIVVAVSSFLVGVVMSVLIELRSWDRNLRRRSLENGQMMQLGEAIRADIRRAAEVSQPANNVLAVRESDGTAIRYEALPEGCRRVVAKPEGGTARRELFSVGSSASWTLTRDAPGRRPLLVATLHRVDVGDGKRQPPLVIHAAVGSDTPAGIQR